MEDDKGGSRFNRVALLLGGVFFVLLGLYVCYLNYEVVKDGVLVSRNLKTETYRSDSPLEFWLVVGAQFVVGLLNGLLGFILLRELGSKRKSKI